MVLAKRVFGARVPKSCGGFFVHRFARLHPMERDTQASSPDIQPGRRRMRAFLASLLVISDSRVRAEWLSGEAIRTGPSIARHG